MKKVIEFAELANLTHTIGFMDILYFDEGLLIFVSYHLTFHFVDLNVKFLHYILFNDEIVIIWPHNKTNSWCCRS